MILIFNQIFENLDTPYFLFQISFKFKLICLTETWSQVDTEVIINSKFQLPDYTTIHQLRNKVQKRGGGTCCFIHNSLMFKERKDLSVNDENNETLYIEIINKNKKNMIVCTTYRTTVSRFIF